MGKLKIGDHWNAITIIALSQNNPLKALAEFVENSIDARAKNISIIRGKQGGEYYIKIMDDGEGIDDFSYVATHIGDSIKRRLKKQGTQGLQGEFGIGLLSFWTVGEELIITSTGKDGKTRRMRLAKGNPAYNIEELTVLYDRCGTELHIQPILAGVRQLTGEKIQNYLASELRDRITKSGVRIRILDKTARRELVVEPRKFQGRLIHNLPEARSPLGEIYMELYMAQPAADNKVGLYRRGTRLLPSLTSIDRFNAHPWTSKYLEGLVDVSFLEVTPGTRDGFIYDDAFDSFSVALEEVEESLANRIKEQEKAEEEEASKTILHKVTRALREAFFMLPQEEYSWLSVNIKKPEKGGPGQEEGEGPGRPGTDSNGISMDNSVLPDPEGESPVMVSDDRETGLDRNGQRELIDLPGPMHSLVISPGKTVMSVEAVKSLKAVVRDRQKREIERDFLCEWTIFEGRGRIEPTDSPFVSFTASKEPEIVIVGLKVISGNLEKTAQAIITVSAELIPHRDGGGNRKGLPGYTFQRAPGELWRSRFNECSSLVIINSGHADFIYASKQVVTKLRYIARLFVKALVLISFLEASKEELLERMAELILYTEEHLR